jgi:hypothetical protein
MASACGYNKTADDKATASISTRIKDRARVQQIISEVGLNPGDFIFSPIPEDNPSQQLTSNPASAFSSYPSQQTQDNPYPVKPKSKSLLTLGRPLSYVQQHPPTPPAFQRDQAPPASQASTNQQTGPPPPPTQPPYQPGPPPPTQPPYQPGPPPPLQPGPSALSFLVNRSAPTIPNTTSQPPQDMNQHSFSPRRLPPSPPPHVSGYQHDSHVSAEHYLHEINSQPNPPVKIVKPSTQNVVYRKEIRIRYLQPPTPPPPAPIIIREKHIPPAPPQSPLLIRERKPDARTPPPLTIRERPPTPPAPLEPYVIDKNLPPPPPQPRQIIVERLPTPPPKPRTVIFEKWLPYKKVKRPVLLQKAPPLEPVRPTRNVIIEYEPLKAFTVRRVIEEGVFRVDPHEYTAVHSQTRSDGGDVRIVERIDDLPPPSEQLMHVLNDYKHHHSSPAHSYDHFAHHNVSEHIPSSVQHLLSGGQVVSNIDHLASVSRASSTPAHIHERVLSTGYNSSIQSPTIVPLQRSDSKVINKLLTQHTPHDSPTGSHIDDVY